MYLGWKASPSRPRSDSLERTSSVMSRKGAASSCPLRTMRIVPAFSVTNKRLLPSLALTTSVGMRRPLATGSRRMVVVAGLKALPLTVVRTVGAGVGGNAVAVAGKGVTVGGTGVALGRAVGVGGTDVAVGALVRRGGAVAVLGAALLLHAL